MEPIRASETTMGGVLSNPGREGGEGDRILGKETGLCPLPRPLRSQLEKHLDPRRRATHPGAGTDGLSAGWMRGYSQPRPATPAGQLVLDPSRQVEDTLKRILFRFVFCLIALTT